MGTNEAETDLRMMADGARGTVTILMKIEIEIATDSVIIMAIGILEAERDSRRSRQRVVSSTVRVPLPVLLVWIVWGLLVLVSAALDATRSQAICQ